MYISQIVDEHPRSAKEVATHRIVPTLCNVWRNLMPIDLA
jgi:hypothetical protein